MLVHAVINSLRHIVYQVCHHVWADWKENKWLLYSTPVFKLSVEFGSVYWHSSRCVRVIVELYVAIGW